VLRTIFIDFLEKGIANGFSADIMVLMSKNSIICSVLKAATSLSGLLLRRLAR